MSDQYARVVTTPEQARVVLANAHDYARTLIAAGLRVRIEVRQDNDPKSAKQRRFLHGPVLTQISEQVVSDGKRYVTKVWKEYFRAIYLGSTWESISAPGEKFDRAIEVRNSTEDLDVKQYSDYIDQVIAHATTEFGVAFVFIEREREEVRHRETKPKATKEKATC